MSLLHAFTLGPKSHPNSDQGQGHGTKSRWQLMHGQRNKPKIPAEEGDRGVES